MSIRNTQESRGQSCDVFATAPSFASVPEGYYAGTVCSFSRYGGYGFIQQDGVQKHKNNNAYFANNKLEPGVLESMRLNRKVVFKLKIGNGIRPTAYNIAFLSP